MHKRYKNKLVTAGNLVITDTIISSNVSTRVFMTLNRLSELIY